MIQNQDQIRAMFATVYGDLPTVEIKLPRLAAQAFHGFLAATLGAMKEQATAAEWDSPEMIIVRALLEEIMKQLPEPE